VPLVVLLVRRTLVTVVPVCHIRSSTPVAEYAPHYYIPYVFMLRTNERFSTFSRPFEIPYYKNVDVLSIFIYARVKYAHVYACVFSSSNRSIQTRSFHSVLRFDSDNIPPVLSFLITRRSLIYHIATRSLHELYTAGVIKRN